MSAIAVGELLAAAQEQYRLLLEESTALLRNFDGAPPEGFDRALARRAEIMAVIQDIDARIAEALAAAGSPPRQNDAAALGAFRAAREEATRRIIEIDSIVMALARERLDHLQREMGALGRGKTALHGYEASGRERSCKLNSTA
uniref:Flagellar protein FliT n=1 Tax=Geobacter metallireducens TaxID=28232 RepID=A0A831U6N8_GEOME